jgi:hypothetical protein
VIGWLTIAAAISGCAISLADSKTAIRIAQLPTDGVLIFSHYRLANQENKKDQPTFKTPAMDNR